MLQSNPEQWAQETLGSSDLGDARRTRRLVEVAAGLASNVGESLNAASEGDTSKSEGAYRLIRNEEVEADAIAEGGFASTRRAIAGYERVLIIFDSTTLTYTHSATEELGDLGGKKGKSKGIWVHSALVVEPISGRTLGLIDQERWLRAPETRGKRHQRKQRAYEDKGCELKSFIKPGSQGQE